MIARGRGQGVAERRGGRNNIMANRQSLPWKVRHQSRESHDYQVNRHDEVQQPWDDEDQNSGDQCDKRLDANHVHIHWHWPTVGFTTGSRNPVSLCPVPGMTARRSPSYEQDDQDNEEYGAEPATNIRAAVVEAAATEQNHKNNDENYEVHGVHPPEVVVTPRVASHTRSEKTRPSEPAILFLAGLVPQPSSPRSSRLPEAARGRKNSAHRLRPPSLLAPGTSPGMTKLDVRRHNENCYIGYAWQRVRLPGQIALPTNGMAIRR